LEQFIFNAFEKAPSRDNTVRQTAKRGQKELEGKKKKKKVKST